MRKLRNFLIIILFLCCAVFLAKDFVLKAFMAGYISKQLQAECKIGKAHVLLKGVNIEGLSLVSRDFELNVKRLIVLFDFPKQSFSWILQVSINDAYLNIINLSLLRQELLSKSAPSYQQLKPQAEHRLPVFKVDLRNIKIRIKSAGNFSIDTNFSLKGAVNEKPFVILDKLRVSSTSIHSDNFSVNNLQVYQEGDSYSLNIKKLKLRDKQFTGLTLPFKLKQNRIIVKQEKNLLLGDSSLLEASLVFSGYSDISISLSLTNSSLQDILEIAAGSGSVDFFGLFDGKINMNLKDSQLTAISGSLFNNNGGFINIKKEANLSFLRKYLDKKSYETLIESLKNYKYNEALIQLGRDLDSLAFQMNCNSIEGGQRNIAINFHNILGGEECKECL